MAVYTRQSSFSDGDTITAALLNNEYDQLLAAFHVATGHTHDGSTTGDGGPLSTLYSNAISFGTGADTDIVVTFNANTSDGVLTWMEDEDLFKFSDAINVGVDDTGYDVKFFGDTASRYWLWDTSADGVVQRGTLTVGVDDTGHDVKLFGATSGSYLLWDESADSLLLTDSTPLKIGDSQDLTLYHDGSNSYITNAVGALKVATETSGIAVTIGHTTSETTIADNATITGDLSVGGNFDVTGTLDFSDSNITNIGSIALDTITNDGTDITLDSSGDIILDADGADVFLKDAGTTFGSLTNTSGNLIIKSGTTTALTFSGANATLAGDLTISGDDLTMGTNTNTAIMVADGTNFNPVVPSGDVGLTNAGVFSIASGVIVNADVNASAAIADSKLATISTADKVAGGAIQIDSGTDGTSITLADTDKFLVDDGGTTKYINASQLNTYTSASIALDDIAAGDAAVTLATSSGNITIDAQAGDTDIIFKGTDSSSDITALTLDMSEAGAATFNNKVVATELDISGDADIDGTLEADAITINGTAIGSIYGVLAGSSSIVTTGALNSGSITSGFGTIDTGSSAISTTGTITYGSLSDGSITATAFVDEDDMSSDSATLIPTQQSVKAYVDAQDFSATSFVMEDGDGTEVTITKNKEMKFVEGGGVDINWTDTDNGTDGDPYDLTFTINAAQTGITSLLATDIKIGEDDQTKIDFETADTINFYAGNEKQLILTDGALTPGADNILDLGSSGVEFKDAYFDGTVTADAFAGPLTGDVTGNVSGTAATVTTAAQSNITSLGTLTTLTVDNVIINGSTIGHTGDTDLITVASGIATVAGEVSMTTLDIGGTNVTATAAELNYCDGVTSNIQTQINALDPTALAIALG